jgi:1-acyl-sn-glycerol-3-phosphate acyltransferase
MDLLNEQLEPALPSPPTDEIAKEVVRDVSQVFKVNSDSWWYGVWQKLLKIPATKFASFMRSADLKVGMRSMWEAARDLLQRYSGGWDVEGGIHFPKEGPLLVVSNHPGATDSLAALAVLERPDVHMVANARPTLKVLPNTSEHMVYLDKKTPDRMMALRNLIRLLEEGQAVILFPRGSLEPEPTLYPGALDSLKHWSGSLGLLLSRVPDTALQLVLSRNVLTPQAWNHPITRLGKTENRKHEIAMILQLIVQSLFNDWKIPIRVTMPEPVPAEVLEPSLDPHGLNTAIKEYVGGEMEKTFKYL